MLDIKKGKMLRVHNIFNYEPHNISMKMSIKTFGSRGSDVADLLQNPVLP